MTNFKYTISVKNHEIKDVLTSSIRNKIDVLILWMRTLKLILMKLQIEEEPINGPLEISLFSDMSRIFYCLEDKIFSVNFPFNVTWDSDKSIPVEFKTKYWQGINLHIVSKVISILSTSSFETLTDINSILDRITEKDDDYSSVIPHHFDVWSFISELLIADDGYIRYDHDPGGAKEHLHPLLHLDIFYQNTTSFKLGLYQKLDLEVITNILDKNSDCHYVHKYNKNRD